MKSDDKIRVAVEAIFPDLDKDLAGGEVTIRHDGASIFVKITQMYEAAEHGLGMAAFVQKMCEAVGLPEMEESDNISRRGCETCDYGSCYGTEFRFWDPSK